MFDLRFYNSMAILVALYIVTIKTPIITTGYLVYESETSSSLSSWTDNENWRKPMSIQDNKTI